jgi:hypothetical protein
MLLRMIYNNIKQLFLNIPDLGQITRNPAAGL